jgi:hypothetical protein
VPRGDALAQVRRDEGRGHGNEHQVHLLRQGGEAGIGLYAVDLVRLRPLVVKFIQNWQENLWA